MSMENFLLEGPLENHADSDHWGISPSNGLALGDILGSDGHLGHDYGAAEWAPPVVGFTITNGQVTGMTVVDDGSSEPVPLPSDAVFTVDTGITAATTTGTTTGTTTDTTTGTTTGTATGTGTVTVTETITGHDATTVLQYATDPNHAGLSTWCRKR